MSEPTAPDDVVGAFQIEAEPVRGRVARLGPAVDEILRGHDYPEPVANLLGEACALAALVGSNLKFEGRLIVEARGGGPVRYVVADYDTTGGLRGYCRFDADEVAAASQGFLRPGAKTLLGDGVFMMTVDQGGDWRAGGILLQYIADDEARGSTLEAWIRSQAFFETIGEDELLDAELPSNTLLYRLFHEDGVRVFGSKPLRAFCRCSQERIETVLRSFEPAERADMVEADGKIHVTCEYCSRVYAVEPGTLATV